MGHYQNLQAPTRGELAAVLREPVPLVGLFSSRGATLFLGNLAFLLPFPMAFDSPQDT